VPVGVATIETHVPGSVPHRPNWPFCGLGGAVYTTVATPLALVTTVRADKVPKSCVTPSTFMSRRRGTPATPLPSGPMTSTLIDDCDPPSWLIASGIAFTVKL
jgi:hypothetical protein